MRNPLIDFALRLGGPWGARPRKITPEVLRRDGMRDYALAAIAFERGDYRAALAGFRQARFGMRCFVCTSFDEGRTLEKLDEPDSAIAQYEHFVNGHNTDNENREFFLAAALRRLGEMYESKGNRLKLQIADCRSAICNLCFSRRVRRSAIPYWVSPALRAGRFPTGRRMGDRSPGSVR